MPDHPASARTILITGCSSGIGYASAHEMRKRGWRVLATARRPDDLARLESEGFDAIPLELSDLASVAACAERALTLTGSRLDALFNNAAFGQPGALEDISGEVLRRQFDVNVIGTHELTRLIIPAMRRQGYGRIVNCSSVLGLIAVPWRGSYSASKFAIEALSDTLRNELHDTGIHVVLIEPGPISTRFIDHALAAARANVDIAGSPHRARYEAMLESMARGGKPRFKLEPEAVAGKLVHALESKRPSVRYYVCTPTYAAAALRRILPYRLLDLVARRI